MSRLMTKQTMWLCAQRRTDQPGHPPSLIRVFAVCMKKAWVLSYQLIAQRRLWSDWTDAQAELNLRWAHTHFVGFVTRRLKFGRVTLTKLIFLPNAAAQVCDNYHLEGKEVEEVIEQVSAKESTEPIVRSISRISKIKLQAPLVIGWNVNSQIRTLPHKAKKYMCVSGFSFEKKKKKKK